MTCSPPYYASRAAPAYLSSIIVIELYKYRINWMHHGHGNLTIKIESFSFSAIMTNKLWYFSNFKIIYTKTKPYFKFLKCNNGLGAAI